ncbi:MAG: hypothetical protein MUF48_01965 [Pirellulaceae bacterium]|jgi:hypothetical protein|nr:hypothetical protein [Pirellulaceae bacterium]
MNWQRQFFIACALMLGGSGLLSLAVAQAPAPAPEWLPTVSTHAWSRFGARAWKEVRVRTSVFGANGDIQRSGTTIARTRVTNIGLNSFSLCVSLADEAAGGGVRSEPRTLTHDVAPPVESSELVGEEQVTIEGHPYPTQVIRFVTSNAAKQETNTVFFCAHSTPQLLKRVTTSVSATNPESATETTVTVTEMNKMADILGELKCTWSATTVIKMRDKTITIREVNCAEVPGELVAQVTEEHNADGMLVSRKELELIGYGYGRPRRGFWRR